ncbi:MAG: hypothetical protein GY849_23000 [Deltaproteobacteria bacterium]|nr:hypothetical protein [Deltaproteobacteria bacterium]
MATKKTRRELWQRFRTGSKPIQEDFEDLFESFINSREDGIEKQAGDDQPLKITAQGDDQNLLDFYEKGTQGARTWRINQKPGGNTGKSGLNISSAASGSRLFIESADGNVGINTLSPGAKLHVEGDTAITGKVGIGTTSPATGTKLHVKGGNLKIETGGLTLGNNTITTVTTQGGISWTSGQKAVIGNKPKNNQQAVLTEVALAECLDAIYSDLLYRIKQLEAKLDQVTKTIPDGSWTKDRIKAYLDVNNITYDPGDDKTTMLKKIRFATTRPDSKWSKEDLKAYMDYHSITYGAGDTKWALLDKIQKKMFR